MLNFANDLAAALDALRRHAILFLLGVTLIALALLGRSWLDAHDASLRLQAALAAQQKTISDADQRQSTRDAQLTQTLAQISAAKQKVQTPAQAAAALTRTIPQLIGEGPGGRPLPSPIAIELPPASTSASASNSPNVSSGNTPPADSRSAGILPANSSAQNSTAPQSDSVARVLEPGVTSPNLSAAANPNESSANASPPAATANHPWTALKLELAHLGRSHAAKPATIQPGLVATQQQSSASQSQQGSSASQTGASASANTATQSAANAQSNSPPQTGASSQTTNITASQSAPPAIIRVPQQDLKPLYDAVEDCEICQAKLTAAQGDLSDEKTKFAAATAQRDAAISAARGTFWTHARAAAKWFVIGAAAGAVLSRYH
jgi:chemotaxis protein histidine kinase CheA